MKGQKMKNAIGSIFFVLVFFILGYGVSGLLAQKWWYPMFSESPAYQYKELYDTDLSDLQAVFLGTSHMEFSVDPMQIYKDKGFVTYNLGSSGQPLEGSYYALEEVFRLSSPKYVFFDVSKLFTTAGNSSHRLIFENMQCGLPKLKYIREWAMLNEEKSIECLISAFFPIVEYHDRWESLKEQDFINDAGKRHYYRKGRFPRTYVQSDQNITLSWMNEIATTKYLVEVKNVVIENGEETVENGELAKLYKPEIYANDQDTVLKMAELCRGNNAQLILVKIPAVRPPQQYSGTWTEIKSGIIKEFAQKADLVFLDLLYDYDLGLEWEDDTSDNGGHLNYAGGKKTTNFFEEYLTGLGLESIQCTAYDEDMDIYNKVSRVEELQTSRDFDEYFQTIRDLQDVSVFISVRDDMQRHLSQEDIDIIKGLGIQTKLEEIQYNDALTLVIENGKAIYEEWSNGTIDHEGVLTDGIPYQIFSSGYLADDKSQIIIDNKNYSCNKRGINIVIYDHESGLVIDSCTFDTWATDKPKATRTLSNYDSLLRNYEEWCMRQSYDEQQKK